MHVAVNPGRLLLTLVATAAMAFSSLPARADDPWPDIKRDVFDNRDIAEEDGTISLDAPYRAEDAAVVPLTMRIPASIARDVKTLTLIIEKNPAPVAATFHFGEAAGVGERMLSTRVRIDMYSNVRAVIETDRRQAAHDDEVREGVGGMLGRRRQGHGRGVGRPWARCRSAPSSRRRRRRARPTCARPRS